MLSETRQAIGSGLEHSTDSLQELSTHPPLLFAKFQKIQDESCASFPNWLTRKVLGSNPRARTKEVTKNTILLNGVFCYLVSSSFARYDLCPRRNVVSLRTVSRGQEYLV